MKLVASFSPGLPSSHHDATLVAQFVKAGVSDESRALCRPEILSTGSFANSVDMKAEVEAMYLNGTPQENDPPQLASFHGSSSWTQAYLVSRSLGSSAVALSTPTE